MGNLSAVNTSSSRGASTARGHFRERLDALVLAQHTRNGALFVISRAEVEYNGLARPYSGIAFSVLPSAGEITLGVAFPVLVSIVVSLAVLVIVAIVTILVIFVGFIRRMRGGWVGLGFLGAAALEM